MAYYSNGDEYCDRRRCRRLNRSRQPVRSVDDIDGLDACSRHIDETPDLPPADQTDDAGYRDIADAVEAGHYDGDLATVGENDTRKTVQEAVDDRLADRSE